MAVNETGSVLIFNAGSSSIKYALIDAATHTSIASGLCERIGHPDALLHHRFGDHSSTRPVDALDHQAAIQQVINEFNSVGPHLTSAGTVGVGHRVVMGGPKLFDPVVITDDVLGQIEALAPLAPLHNPANAAAIRVAREVLADVPHVAVFDTAFFHELPHKAASYAISPQLAAEHAIRRYGFHGISHEYVSQTVAAHLAGVANDAGDGLRQIVLHLGNGASASAVVDGRPIETSMGLTPLEGLVMGSRPGDIDPGIVFYLNRQLGMSIDEIDHLLNHESGLIGMARTNDMRDVRVRATAGDAGARQALDIYEHRLVKYIGAYAAAMGGVDALTFTAGVGENDAALRAAVCEPLGFLGIEIDPERNLSARSDLRIISPDGAKVTVLVVLTQEEASIARQVVALLGRS